MDLEKKLSSIQELSKSFLSKVFGLSVNPKYLILETSVIKPLERICGVKWLRSNGIEKIFKLEDKPPPFESKTIYYIIFSNFVVFQQVIGQIRSFVDVENPPVNKFHILVIPQPMYIFEKELEGYGLLNSGRDYIVKMHSFQWLPIHIDTGLLSLEFPFAFSSLFINNNLTYLPMFSKSLWQLILVLGKVNFTIALGQYSNVILSQFDMLCQQKGSSDRLDSDIGGLIILDRNEDYPSAFLTPGIYSALLKEVYNYSSGCCELKTANGDLAVDSKYNPLLKMEPVVINLDSKVDAIYASTKNKYFTEVTLQLSNLTKDLKMEKMNSQDMSIEEMKKYVHTQLRATNSRKQLVANHLIAAETIIKCLGWKFENLSDIELNIMSNLSKSSNFNFLLASICIENNEYASLRLFCLMLVTQRLTDYEINTFWEKFLHQFGYKYSYTLQNIINAGLISDLALSPTSNKFVNIKLPKFNLNQFYTVANRLKQTPVGTSEIDFKYPTCPSYVFRGSYIPLITQITSMVANSTPLDEIKSKLEGLGSLTIRNERGYPLQTRTILVFIVGGITYAEIGALNFIEALTGVKVIAVSEQIISGNDLMKNFLEISK